MSKRLGLIPIFGALALLIAGLAANVHRSLELGFAEEIPWWTAAGVPGAVAAKYFHIHKRHTVYGAFETVYWGSVLGKSSAPRKKTSDVDDATRAIMALTPAEIDYGDIRPIPGLKGDDKGIVDFVRLSYNLFGISSANFILTYYVVLAFSCLLFFVTFYRNGAYLFGLGAFLALLWLVQPMIRYNDQLTSLLALRAFPLLAIPACLHCIIATYDVHRKNEVRLSTRITTLAQLAIILFCVHIRTSAVWQLSAIVLACLPIAWISWRSHAKVILGFSGGLAACAIGGYFLLGAYHHYGYSNIYRKPTNIATRLFWHNIYSGLAFNPELSRRFAITVDDLSIMRTAGEYLTERGRAAEWASIGGTSEGYSQLQYRAYDRVVREMLFAHCSKYFGDCVQATFFDRPLATARFAGWLYGIQHMPREIDLAVSSTFGDIAKQQMLSLDAELRSRQLFACLWNPWVVASLLAFAALAARRTSGEWSLAALSAFTLTVGSLATVLVGYPFPWTIQDTAVCFGILIYTLIAFALIKLALLIGGAPRRFSGISHGCQPSVSGKHS